MCVIFLGASNRPNCTKNSKVLFSSLELELEKMMGQCQPNSKCQVHNLCCRQHISCDSSLPCDPTPIFRGKHKFHPIVNFIFEFYIFNFKKYFFDLKITKWPFSFITLLNI